MHWMEFLPQCAKADSLNFLKDFTRKDSMEYFASCGVHRNPHPSSLIGEDYSFFSVFIKWSIYG